MMRLFVIILIENNLFYIAYIINIERRWWGVSTLQNTTYMMKRSLSRLGTRRASLKMKIEGRRNQEVKEKGSQLTHSPLYLTKLEVKPIP